MLSLLNSLKVRSMALVDTIAWAGYRTEVLFGRSFARHATAVGATFPPRHFSRCGNISFFMGAYIKDVFGGGKTTFLDFAWKF